MTAPVWVVGKVVGRAQDGLVTWRNVGVFADRTTAAQWAAYVQSDLLLTAEAGTALPGLGDLAQGLVLAREAE